MFLSGKQDPIKYASTRAALAGSNRRLQEGKGEKGKNEGEKEKKKGEKKEGTRKKDEKKIRNK